MGQLDGRVALVTGAARGQGRAHAIRLAEEGADLILLDVCGPLEWSVGAPTSADDLTETVKAVEALDRRVVSRAVDVRDFDGIRALVDDGVAELGRLDIVVANAGTWTYALTEDLELEEWREIVDIALTGAWHTCKATVPHLRRQGEGGAIVLISSAVGLHGAPHTAHYSAAKHGLVGLMQTMAQELGPAGIRVNTVHPGIVNTALVHNASTYGLFAPDLDHPGEEQVAPRFASTMVLPIPWVEPEDVANAVLFLVSDQARYITGVSLPVDGGTLVK